MLTIISILISLSAAQLAAPAAPPPATPVASQPLFTAGQDGYHNYRIPSLIVTKKATVLAFAEGRSKMSDTGDVDLVMRRSTDDGRTWSPVQVVAQDGPNTVGNPCPIVDRTTGTIWLLMNRNLAEDDLGPIIHGASKDTRRVWIARSDDDGLTWSKPLDLTADVKPPGWTWHATGPGCGIQLRSGRLLAPCDHVDAKGLWGAHAIFSDDHGKTWRSGGVAGPRTNECQAAELSNGTLLLNMRNAETKDRSKPHYRLHATSADGGATWSAPQPQPALPEPICQAALITFPAGPSDILIFANPAGPRRDHLTVRLSDDGGKSWPHARLLHAGPSAYSALAVLRDGEILCLYERGDRGPYETITLARFPIKWLRAGASSIPASNPAADATDKPATRPAAEVKIIPRAKWSDRPAAVDRLRTHEPRRLTIHHAGVLDDGHTAGDKKMRGLLRFSLDEKKWGDVPYHFIIDRSGQVFEGRNLKYAPDTNTTYNVMGHVGICLNGDFTRQPVSEAQYRSLVALLTKLTADLHIADDQIAGHKDYAQTDCPGSLIQYIHDGTLRRDLAATRAGKTFKFVAPPLPSTRPAG